jgi:hypothetical protein
LRYNNTIIINYSLGEDMKNLLLAALFIVFTGPAQASLLLDPYVGAGVMKTTFDAASGSGLDDIDNGSMTAIGTRIGYQFLLVSAGIDYSKGSDDDNEFTNTSFFVGVDLPILLRVWAEYFISSDLSIDEDSISSPDFKDGTSIGLGFTALPFVSLNLEVQNLNYESKVAGNKFDLNTAAYLFSVSLPLNF